MKKTLKAILCIALCTITLLSLVACGGEVKELKDAKVGKYVLFGSYQQDWYNESGKKAIEWLVLEVKDGKALLISKYALDCKPYNTSYTYVTWETCTLRNWLNNDFLHSAFSADEMAMILTVTLSDENTEFGLNLSKAQDRVFLLSEAEANKYFKSNKARQCKPTNYAIKNGVKPLDGGYYEIDSDNCFWWLRTSTSRNFAPLVALEGQIGDDMNLITNYAVRPAIWIDLTKIPD